MAQADTFADTATATLVAARLRGATVREAAAAAGLSERQAYRRLAVSGVREELAELRRQLVEAVSARLADLGDDAVDALASLLVAEDTPPSVKLNTARAVLEHIQRLGGFAEDRAELDDLVESLRVIVAGRAS